ncbi:hypothetical protein QP104_07435 [Alloscardovia omnicolens]|uniref:hypothetical protein n=1 Tax=Alloscardovia omnicolens TaxID=419015 RepID=UPI00254EF3F1|nr:hypothetical protein [Alloscardovia omnicolens]MDK6445745.1 hypothetical protein [Alloscardovia omnicolens]
MITKKTIASRLAAMRQIDAYGDGEAKKLARQYGIRLPARYVPAKDRESWTLPEAAEVFSIDYEVLRIEANTGRLAVYRPRTRRGTFGWRRVTRESMSEWLKNNIIEE